MMERSMKINNTNRAIPIIINAQKKLFAVSSSFSKASTLLKGRMKAKGTIKKMHR
jgi:hypothetical protein